MNKKEKTLKAQLKIDSISVIMCTHNRCDFIEEPLLSLLSQRIPDGIKYEIIVVDNNSDDNTEAVVKKMSKRGDKQIKYLREERLGLSYARNLGVEKASGDIIAFIDDDAVADDNWVANLLGVYQKNELAACVGGKVKPLWPDGKKPEWLPYHLFPFLSFLDFGDHLKIAESHHEYPIGVNISFRKEVFQNIGKFKSDLGRVGSCLLSCEDSEFCFRLQTSSLRQRNIYYAPEALVYHQVLPERLTKSYFNKRLFWQGISEAAFESKVFGIKTAVKRILRTIFFYFPYNMKKLLLAYLCRDEEEICLYKNWVLLHFAYLIMAFRLNIQAALSRVATFAAKQIKSTIKLILPRSWKQKDIHNIISCISNYRITPKPRYFHYEITYRCTCRCQFCKRWQVSPELVQNELSTAEAEDVVDQAKEMGVNGISFSGGEPFVRNDIFHIAAHCKQKGMFTHVSTNGTLIDNSNASLVNSLFDSILFSIDSVDEQQHDSLRGRKGTFRHVMSILKLLPREKLTIQMVLNASNIEIVPEFVKFFSPYAARIRLQPIHQNPSNLLIVQNEVLMKFTNEVSQKWRKIKQELESQGLVLDGSEKYYKYFPEFLIDRQQIKGKLDCFMGSHAFFLDPYGNVVPCEEIRKPWGNIRQQSLREIWKGQRKFRQKFNKKDKRPCACLYSCLDGDICFWQDIRR